MDEFFNPETIAVIGASNTEGKVGYVVFKNLKKEGFKTIPINIDSKKVQGVKAYKNIKDYSDSIDLVIVCIPAKFVPNIIDECGEKNIKNVVIISAGFSEVGNEELSNKVLKKTEKHDINIIGPNCLGIINTQNRMNASFFKGIPEYSPTAFVSQSGALGVAVLDEAIKKKRGFSKFISMGNMINTNFGHVINYLGKDDNTKIICLYIEGVKDGDRFLKSLKNCKKPIIVLKAGKSKAGVRAASSHTGSLAGSEKVYNGIFKQGGAIEVNNLKEMFKLAEVYEKYGRLKGNKVCILSNAGGPGVLASDACENFGMKIPLLPEKVKKKLNKFLPNNWSHNNPIDVVGDAPAERYEKSMEILEKKDFYDILLCILTPQDMTEPKKTAKALVNFKEKNKKVITCFMGGDSVIEGRKILEKNNIINFEEPFEFAEIISKIFK